MSSPFVNIFNYADFRKFLTDYQHARQKIEKKFTKSEICKRLGLPNTRSFFSDVVNGKEITKSFVERFIQVLELGKEEGQFFRVLVQFNQANNDQERELYFEQLISLNRTPQKFVDKDSYHYYSKWHHSVVFTLLDVYDFKGNYAELGKRVFPNISLKEAKDSISLLKRLGLIQKKESGIWKATEKTLSVGSYVKDELIKQYQLQCLEIAKQAIINPSHKAQNISTMTLSMSPDINKKIFEKIKKFKAEVRSMVHKDEKPAEKIYQLNLQYYPQGE